MSVGLTRTRPTARERVRLHTSNVGINCEGAAAFAAVATDDFGGAIDKQFVVSGSSNYYICCGWEFSPAV